MTDASSQPGEGSVSRLLGGFRAGDEEAVRQLWRRYFPPLVRLAHARLAARGCGTGDAEDVAVEAFWGLCGEAGSAGRVPLLRDRGHLWRLLACFTARRACDFARKDARRRALRGQEADLDAVAAREPPPEFTAAVADLLECLPSEELRRLAVAKMEGCTDAEAAGRLARSLSTVERKLQVIRAVWRDAGGVP